MLLESKNLTKRFGTKTAVDAVSLSLEEGHVYALLGPNGSGKTTWMKMAAGLIKPTNGVVTFNGKPVDVESRKSIAYVSTEPYFYSWMKIGDAGKYYADFFEDFSDKEYSKMLDAMQLSKTLKISALSSGMTAKMKVALTMARDAKVWMLDEPFNGIDAENREVIAKLILEYAKDIPVLLVSHDPLDRELLGAREIEIKR